MTSKRLHILRPKLPAGEDLAPWLRRMDEARWYSNHGPLEQEFRQRLCQHFNDAFAVTTSSGTAAIFLALKSVAIDTPAHRFVMLPAFTFVATALAVVQAGFIPWIVDVDEATWALTPDMAEAYIDHAPGRLAAVVTVAPFGASADVPSWDAFSERTGVPAVIDAAACFDSVQPGNSPAVISLHATKAFGVGEGGVVVTTNQELAQSVGWSSNFGFCGTRISEFLGTNGKMSELTAAMGLAQFGSWPQARSTLRRLVRRYADQLVGHSGIALAPGIFDGTPSTMNIRISSPVAPIIDLLDAQGIEARQWWMGGLTSHPSLASFPTTDLPVTRKLGETVLGLPLSVDMLEADVTRVIEALGN